MKVKVLFLVVLFAGAVAAPVGPLLRAARADMGIEARREPAVDGYRDGARWVAFSRSGRFERGREWLLLRAGGRSFHAQVGPHAVVQLRGALRTPSQAHARLRQLHTR